MRDPEQADLVIAGMSVRPVEEALATALMTSAANSIEQPLLHELIAREIEADHDARIRMLLTARSMSATRLTELVYDPIWIAERFSSHQADASARSDPQNSIARWRSQ